MPKLFTKNMSLFCLGAYNVEKLSDFTWTYLSYAIMMLYHFVVLLPIALVSSEFRRGNLGPYPCQDNLFNFEQFG